MRWIQIGAILAAVWGMGALAQSVRNDLPLAGSVGIKSFAFEGQTVFTAEQLRAAVKDVLARHGGRLTLDDLEEARQRLTVLYIQAGYINSGAILPDQTLDEVKGEVKFRIVEGRLNQIKIESKTRLRESFIKARIWPDGSKPLNQETLRDNLQLLRQNPNINSLNAELKPGLSPGQSILDVQLTENTRWQAGLIFDNARSPSVGAERFFAFASDTNLLGVSDTLFLRWGLTKGSIVEAEFAELDDVSISYSIPITASDTTLQLSFENGDSPVVEEPFTQLDIRSRTQSYSIGLRQPIYRTINTDAALSLTAARRDNKSFLFGEPFSFSPGSDNGQTAVTVLRFGQEFSTRTTQWAFAFRSTFTLGLDALGSTVQPGDLPDSQYFMWLGQAQYVRRLKNDWQVIVRGTLQLTDDALLPLEQFSLGGMNTVRGYRENQLVRDIAACGTVELRIPLIKKNDTSLLDFAVFLDGGYGKDHRIRDSAGDTLNPTTTEGEFISSAGIGALWTPSKNFNMQVYYGYAFKHFDQNADNLQDWGIHFSMVVSLP